MNAKAARELAVMGVLKSHPLHGYGISQIVEAPPLSMLGLTRHAIYVILERFEKADWVTRTAGEGKAIFALTKEGTREYQRRLQSVNDAALPQSSLVAVLAAIDSGDEVSAKIIDQLIKSRRAWLKNCEADEHQGTLSLALTKAVAEAELKRLEAALSQIDRA